MPESGTDDQTATDDASTAEAAENPIAANTRNVTHPVAWVDAAGDAVDAAEMESTLDYPYLDVAGGTVAEVVGRKIGLKQGRGARIAVPAIEAFADRFLSSDQS